MEQRPLDDDRVEPVGSEYQETRATPQSAGGFRLLIMQAVVALIVAFALIMFYGGNTFLTKSDFQTNIAPVTGDISALKASVLTLNQISTQVTQMNQTLNTLSQEMASLKSNLGNYATANQVNSLVSTGINPLQQSLNSLQNTVSKLPTSQPDLNPLKSQLDLLQKALDDLKGQVTVLQGKITATTAPPTITSFTPSSGAIGDSIVITGTNFANVLGVSFGGTSAASFTVNSATQITAVVGNGTTGVINVVTSGGSGASVSSLTFTGGSGTTTPTSGLVTVSYPTSAFPLLVSGSNAGNNFNITINNGLGKDIFNGQLQLTLQYIGLNPGDYTNQPLTASGVVWSPGSVGANSSLSIVGNTSLYISASGSKTLTVNFSIVAPSISGAYIKITAASFTGYTQ